MDPDGFDSDDGDFGFDYVVADGDHQFAVGLIEQGDTPVELVAAESFADDVDAVVGAFAAFDAFDEPVAAELVASAEIGSLLAVEP